MQRLKLALCFLATLCLALVACEDTDKASAPAEKPENMAQAAEVNIPDGTTKNIAPAVPTTDSPGGENEPAKIDALQLNTKVQTGELKIDSSAFKLGSGTINLKGGIKANKPD